MWKKLRILCLTVLLLFAGICWSAVSEAPAGAKAAETYMVYFDSQGGSQVTPITNVIEGNYLTSLPKPVREGFIFEGWYTDLSYTEYFGAQMPIYDNMVLFAKWRIKEISYIEVSYADKTAIQGSLLDKKKVTVKAHYYDDNSVKILKPEEFEIEDIKVHDLGYNYFSVTAGESYGYFIVMGIQEPLYSISFYSNGGSYVAPISGIRENQSIALPAEPYRDQYEFKGWYLDNDTFRNKFTAEYKFTKSIIVFAKWEKLEVIEEKEPEYTLNTEKMNLNINEQGLLYIKSYDPYLDVEYFSENEIIATVTKDGIIEGKKAGVTTVYAITPEGEMLECRVTVGTIAKSIKLNTTAKQVKKGKTFQIKATFSPSKVSSKKLKYSSSNSKIAKVNSSGKITAVKKGVCYISVKTTDGSGITKKVKIRVI